MLPCLSFMLILEIQTQVFTFKQQGLYPLSHLTSSQRSNICWKLWTLVLHIKPKYIGPSFDMALRQLNNEFISDIIIKY